MGITKKPTADIKTFYGKTLKKALDIRRDFLIDKIADIYAQLGDEEKSEHLMDLLFIYKDELNSIREIIKICEQRGRY